MTQLDQFESTFRAAAKETYTLTPLKIDRVLVATDMEAAEAAALTEAARRFLTAIDREATVWASLAGGPEGRAIAALTAPVRLFRRGEPLALMPFAFVR